jgi:hypothetical protein
MKIEDGKKVDAFGFGTPKVWKTQDVQHLNPLSSVSLLVGRKVTCVRLE